MKRARTVNIIGCGLAGIECALFLADHGLNVHIFDSIRPRYKCECEMCEYFNKTVANSLYARGLMREELKLLGSHLIEQECKFYRDGKLELGCVYSRLLNFGKSLIAQNKNIKVFEINIKEIDFDEPTVIATGPYTDDGLFEWLKSNFGSMRVIDSVLKNPVVNAVNVSMLCTKENDSENLYFPFTYQQYIDFCNVIVKTRNDFLDISGQKSIAESHAIEKLVERDKDAIKNFALKPCKLVGLDERPYAVLKIKECARGYELCGLGSNMPQFLQEQVICSLPPCRQSKIVEPGQVKQNKILNSPFIMNPLCQSNKNPNIFFAGGIIGVEGHLEAMASGLVTGYYLLSAIFDKKFKILPSCTAIGSLLKKIIMSNSLNSSLISANYDIIEGDLRYNSMQEMKKSYFDRSLAEIKKFLEDKHGGSKI